MSQHASKATNRLVWCRHFARDISVRYLSWDPILGDETEIERVIFILNVEIVSTSVNCGASRVGLV